VNPTLLIVGCGKLGIKIGLALKEHFTVIGIKRKPPENFTEFQIISQDIFDETFHLLLEKITQPIFCMPLPPMINPVRVIKKHTLMVWMFVLILLIAIALQLNTFFLYQAHAYTDKEMIKQ
jgi:hypothetical protein